LQKENRRAEQVLHGSVDTSGKEEGEKGLVE
jgi:hypothetical protein